MSERAGRRAPGGVMTETGDLRPLIDNLLYLLISYISNYELYRICSDVDASQYHDLFRIGNVGK